MTHYCYQCGFELNYQLIEGRTREVCGHCGWIHYEQRKVSAGVRIEKDGKLLLVQRGIEPWRGCWHMPAGFLEVDEEPVDAAIREAFEETGLHVKIKDVINIYTYTVDPRGNGIVILYDAEVLGGEIVASPETMNADYFSIEAVKTLKLAGGAAANQVKDWLDGSGYLLRNRS